MATKPKLQFISKRGSTKTDFLIRFLRELRRLRLDFQTDFLIPGIYFDLVLPSRDRYKPTGYKTRPTRFVQFIITFDDPNRLVSGIRIQDQKRFHHFSATALFIFDEASYFNTLASVSEFYGVSRQPDFAGFPQQLSAAIYEPLASVD